MTNTALEIDGQTDALAEVRASRSEALHVDGEFARAAVAWSALFAESYRPAESALKAAIAWFSCGDTAGGLEWMDRARGAGAATDELHYVLGHYYWGRDDIELALHHFALAHATSSSSLAATALGILYWKRGDRQRAHEVFENARSRDPDSPYVLINHASTRVNELAPAESLELLARAAQRAPHRHEPLVLASRAMRRAGEPSAAASALEAARLRRLAVPVPEDDGCDATKPATGEAWVNAVLSPAGFDLVIRYRLPRSQSIELPRFLAVNAGYEEVYVAGRASDRCGALESTDLDFAVPMVRVRVPEEAWIGSDTADLAVRVRGRPNPPCVHLSAGRIELDALSAWLPVPLRPAPLRWLLTLQPTDLQWLVSADSPDRRGVGVLGLRHPGSTTLPCGIRVIGGHSDAIRRAAGDLAQIAVTVWEERLGAAQIPEPTLVLVDAGDSHFCYARPNFIRISSGLFGRHDGSALILHEVGHAFWGAGSHFAKNSEWLAEALAEYTLHLAEGAGHLPGYAHSSLRALSTIAGGELPRDGLAQLAATRGRAAAAALRIKGAFMIAALRKLLGDAAFNEVLRNLFALGRSSEIDAYTFLALASRRAGFSLNWFAHQWIHRPADMTLALRTPRVQRHDTGWRLRFDLSCSGGAISPVAATVEVSSAQGRRFRFDVDLSLGFAHVVRSIDFEPQSVLLDPDHTRYALHAAVPVEADP